MSSSFLTVSSSPASMLPQATSLDKCAGLNHVLGLHNNNQEGVHCLMQLFGGRGVPELFRNINGYGNHTFKFGKPEGNNFKYVKIRLKPETPMLSDLLEKIPTTTSMTSPTLLSAATFHVDHASAGHGPRGSRDIPM